MRADFATPEVIDLVRPAPAHQLIRRGRIANENRPLLDGNDPGEPPRPQSSVHFFPRRANKIAELALGHA